MSSGLDDCQSDHRRNLLALYVEKNNSLLSMIDFECTPRVALEFMNREHQKAFDDANALKILLDSALDASGPVAADIENLLQTLLADTVTHFELEQQCMEEYLFPARADHYREHQRVLQWMIDEHSRWDRDHSVETITHLRRYASDEFPGWLLNHIVTMDTVMASYIHRHGGTSI